MHPFRYKYSIFVNRGLPEIMFFEERKSFRTPTLTLVENLVLLLHIIQTLLLRTIVSYLINPGFAVQRQLWHHKTGHRPLSFPPPHPPVSIIHNIWQDNSSTHQESSSWNVLDCDRVLWKQSYRGRRHITFVSVELLKYLLFYTLTKSTLERGRGRDREREVGEGREGERDKYRERNGERERGGGSKSVFPLEDCPIKIQWMIYWYDTWQSSKKIKEGKDVCT